VGDPQVRRDWCGSRLLAARRHEVLRTRLVAYAERSGPLLRRLEPNVRTISFSPSTVRKNTKLPRTSQGQTQSGRASVSNGTCSGRAYVNADCSTTTAPMPSGRYGLPRCAPSDRDESSL